MFTNLFDDKNWTNWNAEFLKWASHETDKPIDDYFGFWSRLFEEYGDSPDCPLPDREEKPFFATRIVYRMGSEYYPSTFLFLPLPPEAQVVLLTYLPIQLLNPIAKALGAQVNDGEAHWIAPQSDIASWEVYLAQFVLEYEELVMFKTIGDPYSKETLLTLYNLDVLMTTN